MISADMLTIANNIGLVVHIAKKMYRLWNVQERADIEFDDLVQVGCLGLMKAIEKYDENKGSFSNYAAIWIKQAIRRELEGYRETLSLDAEIGEEGEEYNLIDVIADDRVNVVEEVEQKEFKKEIRELLEQMQLSETEKQFLNFKYNYNLEEKAISEKLGMEEVELRNFKRRLITKFRTSPRVRKFRSEWIEDNTTYIRAVDYSIPKVQSSYKQSVVEYIVMHRESMRG